MHKPLTGHKIGFVGLGNMGRANARHLHEAGAEVVVWNRSDAPAEAAVALGMKRAAYLYIGLTCAVYILIVVAAIFDVIPKHCLIALATLPVAFRACRGSLHFTKPKVLGAAMSANVMTVLLTQVFLGIGFLWKYLWS